MPTKSFLTPFGDSPLRRSQANASIRTSLVVLEKLGIFLPEFGYWSADRWESVGAEADEARDCMLGWDVTDFGGAQFDRLGRTLFTLRNGSGTDPRYPKPYAEKFLIEPEGQRSPIHYHLKKREDIINRGGGNVIVCLHRIGEDGMPGPGRISVSVDGFFRTVNAGDQIRLRPGQSVSIPPSSFHQFWAEEGTGYRIDGVGYTVSGEVSSVCDDWRDNNFIDEWANRFPKMIEDEPREFYLCHEYPAAAKSVPAPVLV